MTKPRIPGSRPSVVQLPGGITLQGVQFNIVEYHPDGTPKLFELQPRGVKGECSLYADESWIRGPRPDKGTVR